MRTKQEYQKELDWLKMLVECETNSVLGKRAIIALQELIDNYEEKK